MKLFVSYTASDADWAHWIGYVVRSNGYEPFIHEWEIEAGANIPAWMERRLAEADRVLCLISPEYVENRSYSKSERLASYWDEPVGEEPFVIPIVVKETEKLPGLVRGLRRAHLHGKTEAHAEKELVEFLKKPLPPSQKPEFPGDKVDV